ncbi:hypothetical protein JL2886_03018 [Phaeobacter gallaeciensis]|uniref:Uncharacterized protein n=1 Tax=Phaeobacter gallaeciensis TaxID=60890 RepID=A0A1B0ZUY7_9RHOB|nr:MULTISPECIES: hypothetical protein [Phaeobacter]MDF1773790.1 hypothetical protein [Pseudophaeobacter sp. bin_em_oilr2.035]MEE2635082.1 hypothetical protein [Pseudomonadota bacterium]ANP37904.1 hypothetical protein JL2886_03018 [Phaeobacter gallaeciensis]MDE4060647.1 hypothetical protein [Phaeobacter gallaeciensis]MDE4123549.1 hypothetical protein [Phaeobacter gallaeciensis]
MYHDPHFCFGQAPAAPAAPVSQIRLPRSIPVSHWPFPGSIPGVAREMLYMSDDGAAFDAAVENAPHISKTLH